MEITILTQIFIIFVYMMIGYTICRKRLIDDVGSKQISNILLYICRFTVILNAFQAEFSIEVFNNLWITLVLSVMMVLLGYVVARIVYKNDHFQEQLALGLANVGLMGIPLVDSILGKEAIIYLSVYLGMTTLIAWIYGIYMMTHSKQSIQFKKIMKNPAMLGLVAGFIFFMLPFQLPASFSSILDSISTMKPPLAMILLGTYVGKSNIIEIFNQKALYKVSFYRLVVIPILTLSLLLFLPNDLFEIKMV